MASSFISFDNRDSSDSKQGFWIHDSLMQIACGYIVKAIDSQVPYEEDWLSIEMRSNLMYNFFGFYSGFMHLDLSVYLDSEYRKEKLSHILKLAESLLQLEGDYISAEKLNANRTYPETQGEWSNALETKRIIKIFAWVKMVVDGNLPITIKTDSRTYTF